MATINEEVKGKNVYGGDVNLDGNINAGGVFGGAEMPNAETKAEGVFAAVEMPNTGINLNSIFGGNEEETKVGGVFGGVEVPSVGTNNEGTFENDENQDTQEKVEGVFGGVQTAQEGTNLPVKRGFWSSMKAFWLQDIDWNAKINWTKEIKVELTPYQQKVEDELNDFLYQEITWEKVRAFFTKKLTFGKNK